ncbi:Nucleotide exchange factor SIL1 [Gryllus bimaculatus]|nr:Nucleotide exchange factor SIL1 [Gryllus bimaculatus]
MICVNMRVVILVILCLCSFASPKGSDKDSSGGKSTLDDAESIEVFKPTHEWQSVKKGQPIPKGLHVRVNLQTGETEAKLISNSNNERTDVLSVHDDVNSEEDRIEADELSKEIVDAVRERFRSYKELKEAFKQLNMTVKTDLEIMHELIFKYKNLQRSQKTSYDEILAVLTDMEYLVHQFDNALEFVRLEGVSDIVIPMLNCSSPAVRAEAARLLGSAAQSNVKVQIAALENGAIFSLLRAVSLDSDSVVRIRSLYALSCLIRNFPAAQARFVKEGGLSVLAQLFDKEQENHKMQIKVITLLYDLLIERQDTIKLFSGYTPVIKEELEMKMKQYKEVGLEKSLLDQGWCSKIPAVLLAQDQNWSRTKKRDDLSSALTDIPVRPEHDFVEKVVDTLLAMVEICHHDFNINSDLKRMIIGLREWYLELAMKEELNKSAKQIREGSDESSNDIVDEGFLYYSGIARTLERLTRELEKFGAKDEL